MLWASIIVSVVCLLSIEDVTVKGFVCGFYYKACSAIFKLNKRKKIMLKIFKLKNRSLVVWQADISMGLNIIFRCGWWLVGNVQQFFDPTRSQIRCYFGNENQSKLVAVFLCVICLFCSYYSNELTKLELKQCLRKLFKSKFICSLLSVPYFD